MTVTTRWWWIRHAPVTSYDGRVYGQTDVPANVSERPAFEALASALPDGALWVTSNLRRTAETAGAIADAGADIGVPLVEPDLAEQHFGEWQGQNRADIYRRHADWSGLWLAPVDRAPPGGESFVQVMARVADAIERLSSEHPERDIVAVAHGGSIKAALGHALGLAPEVAVAFNIDNLSLTRLDRLRGASNAVAWRIKAVNLPPGRGG